MTTSALQRARQRANRKLKRYRVWVDKTASLEGLAMSFMAKYGPSRSIGKRTRQGTGVDESAEQHGLVEYHKDGVRVFNVSRDLGESLDFKSLGLVYVPVCRQWIVGKFVSDQAVSVIADTLENLMGEYHVS